MRISTILFFPLFITNKTRQKRGDKYVTSYERKRLLDSAIALRMCIGHLIWSNLEKMSKLRRNFDHN